MESIALEHPLSEIKSGEGDILFESDVRTGSHQFGRH